MDGSQWLAFSAPRYVTVADCELQRRTCPRICVLSHFFLSSRHVLPVLMCFTFGNAPSLTDAHCYASAFCLI